MMRAAIAQFHFCAHGGQQLAGGFDVAYIGDIFQHHRFVGKQGRRHGRQSGIFCPRNAHRPQQRIAAANYKFIHR